MAFSIVNLVFPSFPAIRPIARERWSPAIIFTSSTLNDSIYKSSILRSASASYEIYVTLVTESTRAEIDREGKDAFRTAMSNPMMHARTNSAALSITPKSSVSLEV